MNSCKQIMNNKCAQNQRIHHFDERIAGMQAVVNGGFVASHGTHNGNMNGNNRKYAKK